MSSKITRTAAVVAKKNGLGSQGGTHHAIGKRARRAEPLPKGVQTELAVLAVADVHLPPFQRPANQTWVNNIAANFSPHLNEPIHVALREADNSYYVIDGQHRLLAHKRLGLAEIKAFLHMGLSTDDEARLFTGLQDRRLGLAPVHRFNAQLWSNDPIAVGVDTLLERHGFKVSGNGAQAPDCFQGPTALMDEFRRNPEQLDNALAVIRGAWKSGEKGATASMMVHGLCYIFEQGEPTPEVGHLVHSLKGVKPTDISLRAAIIRNSVGMSPRAAMAKALLDAYNYKRSTHRVGLPGLS